VFVKRGDANSAAGSRELSTSGPVYRLSSGAPDYWTEKSEVRLTMASRGRIAMSESTLHFDDLRALFINCTL
jgi:hypothetical protein